MVSVIYWSSIDPLACGDTHNMSPAGEDKVASPKKNSIILKHQNRGYLNLGSIPRKNAKNGNPTSTLSIYEVFPGTWYNLICILAGIIRANIVVT